MSDSPGVDLTSMSKAGVPAISPLQDARHYFEYHHTAADTFDKVRLDDFRKNVASLAVMGYVLADMPDRLTAVGGRRGSQ